MAITGGFGMTMDLERGTMRHWVMGRDGVKRWADSGAPCVRDCDRSVSGDCSPRDDMARTVVHGQNDTQHRLNRGARNHDE